MVYLPRKLSLPDPLVRESNSSRNGAAVSLSSLIWESETRRAINSLLFSLCRIPADRQTDIESLDRSVADLAVNNAFLLSQPTRGSYRPMDFPIPATGTVPARSVVGANLISSSFYLPWAIGGHCLVGWHARTALSHWCLQTFNRLIAFYPPHSLQYLRRGWELVLLKWASKSGHSVTRSPLRVPTLVTLNALPTSSALGCPRERQNQKKKAW